MLLSVVIIIVVVVKTFHFSVFRPTLLNAVSGRGEFAVLVGDRRRTALHCSLHFSANCFVGFSACRHNDTSKY